MAWADAHRAVALEIRRARQAVELGPNGMTEESHDQRPGGKEESGAELGIKGKVSFAHEHAAAAR
jgi:hypothetical protein